MQSASRPIYSSHRPTPVSPQTGIRRVAIACALLLPVLPLKATHPWIGVQSEDARVVSDASAKELVEFAMRYSAFRSAFNAWLAPLGIKPPPSTVMIFRSASSLRDCAAPPGNEKLVSYSTEIGDRALLALSIGNDRESAMAIAILSHTVWLLRSVGYYPPLWMAQGTGEVFSTIRIRDGQCILGEEDTALNRLFETEEPLDWNRFFQVYTDAPEYKGPLARGVYQAQAWALMHLVLLGGNSPRERFHALIGQAHGNSEDWTAAALVAGTTRGDLSNEISIHLRRARTAAAPFDEMKIRRSLVVSAVPEAEVCTLRTELLRAAGKTALADAELDRASSLAPNSPGVKEALARREMRHNNADAAVQDYRDAIAAGSTDSEAFLASAGARIDESASGNVDSPGGGGNNIPPALAEIHQAIRLAPASTGAYVMLARAFYVAPKITESDVAELQPALGWGSDGLRVLLYRALLYERLGRDADCIADLHHLIELPSTPSDLRRDATDHLGYVLFQSDRKRVEHLVAEGKFGDAAGIVRNVLGHPGPFTDVNRYRTLADWLDHFIFDRDQRRIGELLQNQRLDTAETIVKQGLANSEGTPLHAAYLKLGVQMAQAREWYHLLDLFNQRRWDEAKAAADALLSEDLPPAQSHRIQALRDLAASRLAPPLPHS